MDKFLFLYIRDNHWELQYDPRFAFDFNFIDWQFSFTNEKGESEVLASDPDCSTLTLIVHDFLEAFFQAYPKEKRSPHEMSIFTT